LSWNAAPEIIAAIVILILILNTTGTQSVPTPRNRMFHLSLHFTFICIVLNLLTVLTISYATQIPLWLNMLVNTTYFMVYPFMPLVFIIYMLLFIFENSPERHKNRLKSTFWMIGVCLAAYLVLTLVNLPTGWIFSFDTDFEYIRGPLNKLPLLLIIAFIILSLVQAIPERAYMDKFLLRIIAWFPLLSLSILGLQVLYPNIVLTGTAMMLATLSVHLNFQVKKISEDDLTKLPNRETFIKTLDLLSRRSRPVTILLISLDDFKYINDTYGRMQGDRFLVAIKQGLQSNFPGQRLYRYSGDEFSLIIESKHMESEALLAKKVVDLFRTPWTIPEVQARIGASVAVLSLPLESEEAMDPINLLDHVVRKAKNQGKNQYIVCDDSIFRAMRRRNRLIERLHQAVDTGGFSIQYQPIYHLRDGQANSAEALLRLHDDLLGDVVPSEFIPLAEEIGLINEIGLWVFSQVCAFLDRLRKENLPLPAIAINFSVQQLTDSAILEKMIRIIESYHLPENLLKLEITESMFIGSTYQEMLAVMEPLIARGIHFHLDDFGTGYSNLAYVINLPFDCIKLDKTLMWDIEHNERMQVFVERLVRAVIQMGSKVIIEGIETEEQRNFLKRVECDMVQGFIFSPPLDEQDFIKTLAQKSQLPLTKSGL